MYQNHSFCQIFFYKQAFFKLTEAHRRLGKKMMSFLMKNQDFARPQTMFLLDNLSKHGRIRLKDIAELSGHSAQNLCMLYGKLEKKGLVAHEVDAQNRRNTYYFLTSAGKSYLKRHKAAAETVMTRLFACLTPEESNRFQESLRSVCDVLNKVIEENKDESVK